jgi:hypothetical protein
MSAGGRARRRICLSRKHLGGAVSALAEAQGHEVVGFEDDGRFDLIVIDGEEIHPLQMSSREAPVLVMSLRRLRDPEITDFKRSGATRVLDGDASLLDLAFAMSDLLFDTRTEQRRYAKTLGGVTVEVLTLDDQKRSSGSLLGIARCGAILLTRERIVEGTRIEMRFTLAGSAVALRGRVAYVDELNQHVGIEFALDDAVAPKMSELGLMARPTSLGAAHVSV